MGCSQLVRAGLGWVSTSCRPHTVPGSVCSSEQVVMQFASCLSCCLLCMGLHIQMTLLAEVTEFAFLQPETTERQKKSWLSISLITFFEGKSINLNFLLLTELLSASPTIYICEGLLKNTLHASIYVDELYLRNLLSLKNAGTLLYFHFWVYFCKITIFSSLGTQ